MGGLSMTKHISPENSTFTYPPRREYLLMILHELQNRNPRNFLDQSDLEETARYLKLSTAELAGVAEYYSLFSTSPRGRFIIRLCTSPVCRMAGSFDLLASLTGLLGIKPGETTEDGLITLEHSECLGNCHRGPSMMINDTLYGNIDQKSVAGIIKKLQKGEMPKQQAADRDRPESGRESTPPGEGVGSRVSGGPRPGSTSRESSTPRPSSTPREGMISLGRAGDIDPESLEDYRASGGFNALEGALQRAPEDVYREVTNSGLQGRGGAGFPTGKKEQAAEEALCGSCGPKYVVCNADEGEPGTFKDRILMEQNPFQLIEGMIISGWAIGAHTGYIYIRGEYTLSIQRLTNAVESCREAGYLSAPMGPEGFTFDLEIRLGAGSYLCGEELTLLESLEGKRGYPRIKPPFPVQRGLFGAPTLLNNVETFAHVPFVIEKGAEAYRSLGTEASPGSKIFCVSGDVNRPGYLEAPMGITLNELIEHHCGGVKGPAGGTGTKSSQGGGGDAKTGSAAGTAAEPTKGASPPPPSDLKQFQAVLLGGAAGSLADHSILNVPMTYGDLKEAGASLGSGAVIVLNESRSLYDLLLSILHFFRHESCGKCVPCRVGTDHLVRVWEEAGSLSPGSRGAALEEVVHEAEQIAAASLCPLGKSPIISLKSALRFFRDAV